MLIEKIESARPIRNEIERRTRLGLYIDVLKVIAGGTNKPTRILYEARLSWTSMKGVMDFLIENELVVKEKIVYKRYGRGITKDQRSRERYAITDKGLTVLKFFDREQILANLLTK